MAIDRLPAAMPADPTGRPAPRVADGASARPARREFLAWGAAGALGATLAWPGAALASAARDDAALYLA
ncbi:MAG: hypothetical protein NTT76_16445, partial [Achromobacter xylosoxidans]|nr:hypothetical protein [Achromobacter xylosoxidans]